MVWIRFEGAGLVFSLTVTNLSFMQLWLIIIAAIVLLQMIATAFPPLFSPLKNYCVFFYFETPLFPSIFPHPVSLSPVMLIWLSSNSCSNSSNFPSSSIVLTFHVPMTTSAFSVSYSLFVFCLFLRIFYVALSGDSLRIPEYCHHGNFLQLLMLPSQSLLSPEGLSIFSPITIFHSVTFH